MDFMTFAKEWGLPLAFVAFFIWRDWKREDVLLRKYDEIIKYQREKLEELIAGSTKAITDFTNISKQMIEELNSRPCLVAKNEQHSKTN